MAKLSRKTQKIFASNSAQNQVSTFGSIKAGVVAYSKDVSNIQTEAFEGGWSSAVQDDYAPYRQDRNAVDFVTTSQLAYVFQEGVPEYDANTTYYKGSWVKGLDGDTYAIYESLSDDNIGNDLSDEEKWEAKSFGGGLEIGDIGIAPLGINEAQNKRRYLNGQVISQAQFVSFTNKLKDIVRTYPSLATSETNWQATVTNSKLGQCGKFVIDDALGTIRLPKVVNINGLQDLALMGSIKAESLPNITGNSRVRPDMNASQPTGAFYYNNLSQTLGQYSASGTSTNGISFDASRSSSTYQDNAPVQQEAIQYPYFIQVATGVEESVDVTREIELNNPFSLLDYKWSEYEITNASWLLSNGAFHSGTVYVAVYELLLKIYNGTETKEGVSVKLSTEAYEDTDFVLNTTDTTFRLPLYTQRVLVKKYVNGTEWYNLYSDGWCEQGFCYSPSSSSAQTINLLKEYKDTNYTVQTTYNTGSSWGYPLFVNNKTVNNFILSTKSTWNTSSVIAISVCGYANIPTSSDFTEIKGLYFYVGETIQDANVINASQVLTTVADCVRKSSATDKETIIGWGIPDYSAGISVSFPYTAPTYGFINIRPKAGNNYIYININGIDVSYTSSGSYGQSSLTPVSKSDEITINLTSGNYSAIFYPLKGVN